MRRAQEAEAQLEEEKRRHHKLQMVGTGCVRLVQAWHGSTVGGLQRAHC